MSQQNTVSPPGLTSPLGKSLLTAFSRTIEKMEARITEKSKPTVIIDRQEEILRKYNIDLESHLALKSDAKQEVAIAETHKNIKLVYQGRSEAAFLNEHSRICRRAPFHMAFTDPQNEDEQEPVEAPKSIHEPSRIQATSDLGRFEDSECSSDEDVDSFFDSSTLTSQINNFSAPAHAAFDSEDQFSKLLIVEKSPSQQLVIDVGMVASDRDDASTVQPEENAETFPASASATDIQTSKLDELSLSSKSLTSQQPRPKPMKFSSANTYSNQTAAEEREYALSIIGVPRPAGIGKVTARRFYIESCEQQKITPHISHISKSQGSSATSTSTKELTTNLKGIGEKRLMALSRFIQDRLHEDGSQLILRESLLGNDACKVLQKLALDSDIPCKIRTLDLSDNCFNAIGIRTLSPILKLSSLMRLILSKLNLGDSGVCTLIDILCGGSGDFKSDEAISRFETVGFPSPRSPKLLPKSPKISSSLNLQHVAFLDLSHNSVRTQGANSIARLIQVSTSLVHLELGWNAIGPLGSSAIEKSLQKNSTLTFLGLSWNGLDESGGVSMSYLLGTSKFLQELDLSNNRISMVATCLISSALRQNTCLKALNIAGNLIGKTGCKSLFRVMRWQETHRRAKVLEKIEAAKIDEFSLNLDGLQHNEIKEWSAASINVDACVFEDQVKLDIGLHNCNGFHALNLKNIKDRATLAELMELSYVGESSPSAWSNCSIDGKLLKISSIPANHVMPPSSGLFEGSFNLSLKACDMPNCIDSSAFSVVLHSITNRQNASTNVKIAIAMSHFSEFVFFSCQHVRAVLSCFDEPDAHCKILINMYCKIVDIQDKDVFITKLSQETLQNMKKKLGQLFEFCAEFPMRHYRIDLSQKFDVELFQKLQSTSTIQRRLACSIRLPDTSQYPLIPMCIRNVRFNGVNQKDFGISLALPKAGIVELDFTSIMTQIPDRKSSLNMCSDSAFMKMRQCVYAAMSNATLGLDVLAKQLQMNLHSITTKQAFFLIALWPPIFGSSLDCDDMCATDENFARVDALVLCFSHISDLENLWPALRSDSEYNWKAVQLICCRIGWLNVWNPLDADGYYELDLSVRDQKIVCECLVVLSVKEPGENWQDETFNGQRFELPVTWVSEVPDRGIVTLTYTSGLKKRNMLIEIRKQLANRCLIRYCINKLPKNEEDMIEEERKMQQMTSDAAAAALAQGYADLAEDDESKEIQELILKHTDSIMVQEGVIAAIQKEMELRMMDDVQKYLELKKKLAVEMDLLEKQKEEVNAVIEEAKRKVSAESLETFGIEAQGSNTEILDHDTTTSSN